MKRFPNHARVLVIDADEQSRDVAVDRLRSAGHDVNVAASASEGVEIARRERPDVIVLDDEVLDGDGWRLVPLFKRMQGVHVIAVTANATPRNVKRALLIGADAFLERPWSPGALVVQVDRLLAARASGCGGAHH